MLETQRSTSRWQRIAAGTKFCAPVLLLAITACGGGGGGGVDNYVPPTYTIGGSVTGFTGGTLVLQLNGANDLAVNANGPFTFGATISQGGTYAVAISVQPASQFCSVGNGAGTVNGNVSNVVVNCSSVGALYPGNGANWNDWVVNDGAIRLDAGDRPCTDADAAAGFSGCVHGGEMRTWNSQQAVDCAGLTARDALDAFEWTCESTGGNAVFMSVGLKAGRRLSDLIDFAALIWRDNRIEVTGARTFNSPWGKWWSNPIVAIGSSGELTEGTIHVVTADVQAALTVRDRRVALVVQPGRTLRAPAGATAIVKDTFDGVGFWLEGDFDATGATSGIVLWYHTAAVLRGVRVTGAGENGIDLQNAAGTWLEDVHVANNGGDGLAIGRRSRASGIRATNNGGNGIHVYGSVNRISDVVAAGNAGSGVVAGPSYLSARDSVFARITAINNGVTGIAIGGNNVLAFGLVAENNGELGIQAFDLANTVADAAAAGNGLGGIRIMDAGTRTTGVLKVGAASDCMNAIYGCVNTSAPGSDAVFNVGANISAAFIGKVTVDDTTNDSDSLGAAAFSSVADWVGFDNSWRGWGIDGGTFPDVNQRGRCVSGGNCRIWDWSLIAADAVLRATLAIPAGSDFLDHVWSAGNSTDCAAIPGATWGGGICTSRILRHAVELDSGVAGNRDGLCSSGETCLYMPNIGAYQGHGDLATVPFTGDPANITGVILFRHALNGR
jgi:hypothetical protein